MMQSRQWRTTLWLGSTKNPQLGRFWAHRGEDGIKREKQLLIDFLCEHAGGPMYYRREMLLAHRGMKISGSDWNVFLGHAAATLTKFKVRTPSSAPNRRFAC